MKTNEKEPSTSINLIFPRNPERVTTHLIPWTNQNEATKFFPPNLVQYELVECSQLCISIANCALPIKLNQRNGACPINGPVDVVETHKSRDLGRPAVADLARVAVNPETSINANPIQVQCERTSYYFYPFPVSHRSGAILTEWLTKIFAHLP